MDKKIYELPQLVPAITKVREWADATGQEFAVVVEARSGTWLVQQPGNEKAVEIRDPVKLRKIPGNWFVHSHPITSSLSMEDVFATANFGAAGVIATTREGVYAAHNIKHTKLGAMIIKQHYTQSQHMFDWLEVKGFTYDNIMLIESHWMNLKNAQAGVYKYDYLLGKSEQATWDQFLVVAEGDGYELDVR